jgi:hypothetical protein
MEALKLCDQDWLMPSDRCWVCRVVVLSDGVSRTRPHRACICKDARPGAETSIR